VPSEWDAPNLAGATGRQAVTERHEDDEDQTDPSWKRAAPTTNEGVRILGAEEAQAVIEGGSVARRLGEDSPRFGDVPARPDPTIQPAVRFPLPDDTAGTWARGEESPIPQLDFELEPPPETDLPTRAMQLPHWTEPPTGEVPRISIDDEEDVVEIEDDDPFAGAFADDESEDAQAWASITGSAPRFRTDSSAWQEDDVSEAVPALETPAEEPVVFDDDEDEDTAFAAAVAARRAQPISSGVRRTPPRPAPGAPQAKAETGAPRAGANAAPDLAVRVATALGVAVAALICFSLGAPYTVALITIIIGLGSFEMFEGLRRSGFKPAHLIGVLGAVAIVPIAYNKGLAAYPLICVLVLVFSMLWYLVEVVRARPVVNVAVTLFGFGYLGLLGGFAGLILGGGPNGVGLVIGLALCAVGYDAFGYFVGSQFGSTRLLPKISPNKTIEGLVGGMLASVIVGLCLGAFGFTPFKGSIAHGFALGAIVAVIAPLGDLCESMFKRDLGVKDFGQMLPGHGGVLDRFDAMLFCLPAVYYLALALHLFTVK
jgi:phosphatidate cytidylyltransferase